MLTVVRISLDTLAYKTYNPFFDYEHYLEYNQLTLTATNTLN